MEKQMRLVQEIDDDSDSNVLQPNTQTQKLEASYVHITRYNYRCTHTCVYICFLQGYSILYSFTFETCRRGDLGTEPTRIHMWSYVEQ